MQNITTYQTSVFGDFASYEPNLERMNLLAKMPLESNITLLPTTVNVITVDASSPQGIMSPKIIQRINMVDTTQHWNIAILPDRLDVNFAQQNEHGAIHLAEISSNANSLLNKSISTLDVKYWRIAINLAMQIEVDVDNVKNISILHNALTKPLSHQINKESTEWQVMSNCPQKIIFPDDKQELLNVILAITRQVNPLTKNTIAVAQLDINTSVFNKELRFDESKFEHFYTLASKIINEIIENIMEKWSNG